MRKVSLAIRCASPPPGGDNRTASCCASAVALAPRRIPSADDVSVKSVACEDIPAKSTATGVAPGEPPPTLRLPLSAEALAVVFSLTAPSPGSVAERSARSSVANRSAIPIPFADRASAWFSLTPALPSTVVTPAASMP